MSRKEDHFISLPKVKIRWLFLLLIAPLFLAACAGGEASTSWPGLSAADGRVYVAYANQLIAVDGENGQQIWQYNGEGGEQFYAAPLVNDGRVIVGDYGTSGGIFSGGRLSVKIHAIEDADSNPPSTAWIAEDQVSGRIFASALQVDDRIFVGTGNNSFVALDANTGNLIWEVTTGNAIWSRPIFVDGTVFFSSLDKNVYALSADNGELIWSRTLPGASAGSPLYNEETNLLYLGSFSGDLIALDIANGEIVWETPAADWVWGTPTLSDGVIYYTDLSGFVYAVDAVTGDSIWAQSVQVPGSVDSAVLVVDDLIFVASGDEETLSGSLTALNKDGEMVWQESIPAQVQTPPVAIDGDPVIVYIPEDQPFEVARFDRTNGNVVWRFSPPVEQ